MTSSKEINITVPESRKNPKTAWVPWFNLEVLYNTEVGETFKPFCFVRDTPTPSDELFFGWVRRRDVIAVQEQVKRGMIPDPLPEEYQWAVRMLWCSSTDPVARMAVWFTLYCRNARIMLPAHWHDAEELILGIEEHARFILAIRHYPLVWPLSGPFLPAFRSSTKPAPGDQHIFVGYMGKDLRYLAEHYAPIIIRDRL